MRLNLFIAALVGWAWLGQPLTSATELGNAEHLAGLITRLGSRDFANREEASKTLEAIGGVALNALRHATASDDAEVRRRADELVRRIEQRQETAQLLQPKRLRLSFRNTPIPDAVTQFAKLADVLIDLDGDRGQLAGRTITLDTGETTFWNALDQFCRSAGLIERDPLATAARDARTIQSARGRQVLIIDVNGRVTTNAQTDGRFLLGAGQAPPLPTVHSGALRIRTLPPAGVQQPRSDLATDVRVHLEALADPGLAWQRMVAVRIDKAIDDQDQSLVQPMPFVSGAVNPSTQLEEAVVLWKGVAGTPGAEPQRRVTLNLVPAAKPSRSLKVLSGTVSGQVLTSVQPLVTVHDILQSVGETVRGDDGTTVRVIEANRAADGRVQLRLEVTSPPKDADPFGVGLRVFRINRGVVANANPISSETAASLTLLDDRGQSFRLVSGESVNEIRGLESPREYRLTYEPGLGKEPPSRLVISGRRAIVIDVPFALKDVPLP